MAQVEDWREGAIPKRIKWGADEPQGRIIRGYRSLNRLQDPALCDQTGRTKGARDTCLASAPSLDRQMMSPVQHSPIAPCCLLLCRTAFSVDG